MMIIDNIKNITPEVAKEFLKKLDDCQRDFSDYNYNKLKSVIDKWGWQTWLSRVVVSTDETILDGQHTLRFIANQEPRSIWRTRIIRNVPPEMVEIIAHYATWSDLEAREKHHNKNGFE